MPLMNALRTTALALLLGLAACTDDVMQDAEQPASRDIVDTLASTGQFTTLVAALEAADLVDMLKGPGPLTIFAPTDEAFEELGAGTVQHLMSPKFKGQLTTVLTYHVVATSIVSSDIADARTNIKTVEGGRLSVDATDGIKVNDGSVTAADIEASNGVIHVIDTVLLPN